MTTAHLPEGFSDLENLVDEWVLPSTTERTRKRHACTMGQIVAYYDAVKPRLQDILEHLNTIPYDNAMPDEARRLLGLALMLAEVTTAVEWYHQPGVVDGFDPERFVLTAELP